MPPLVLAVLRPPPSAGHRFDWAQWQGRDVRVIPVMVTFCDGADRLERVERLIATARCGRTLELGLLFWVARDSRHARERLRHPDTRVARASSWSAYEVTSRRTANCQEVDRGHKYGETGPWESLHTEMIKKLDDSPPPHGKKNIKVYSVLGLKQKVSRLTLDCRRMGLKSGRDPSGSAPCAPARGISHWSRPEACIVRADKGKTIFDAKDGQGQMTDGSWYRAHGCHTRRFRFDRDAEAYSKVIRWKLSPSCIQASCRTSGA